MTFTAKNIFNRKSAEDKSESTIVTRSASANNGDDSHGNNQFQVNEGSRKRPWFGYIKTREFWMALALGQILALCITATNTFTSLLVEKGTNIPAFQTFFTYALLNLVYSSYTIYSYGFGKWARVILKDWWRYLFLAFCDVEGNYFIVLAYRYTNILSAQLINFWAIVVVVIISFILLKVRYRVTQYIGILLCCGGMGVLLASDHIQGNDIGGDAPDQLKGDLFAVAAATFYGLANVVEEVLVSRRPLFEVVGQLGFWAMLINGPQAAIFDRDAFHDATWDGAVAGYLIGYTLVLFTFYSLAPVLFRLASAAFFNISLLTASFWGVLIGLEVFDLEVHWMYPIAFVLIIFGQFVYFLMGSSVFGEAKKPWLGENQERGVDGVGTARRGIERGHAVV